MAVNRDPILKRCRYLGISPTGCGHNQGIHQKPKRKQQKKGF